MENRKILGVVAGLALSVMLGSYSAFGGISIYLASYYHLKDPSVTMGTFSVVPFISAIVTIVGQGICAFAIKFVSPRVALIASVIVAASSTFICSMFVNFYLFILFYAVIFGIGMGVGGYSTFIPLWKNFTTSRGKLNGVLFAVVSLSGLGFSELSAWIANPDNLKATIPVVDGKKETYLFDEEVASRTPRLLMILAGIYLACGLIAAALMLTKDLKEENKKTEDEYSSMDANTPAKKDAKDSKPVETDEEVAPSAGKGVKAVLASRAFWQLYLSGIFCCAPVSFIETYYKDYGQARIRDDHFLTTAAGIGLVVNGCSKILGGIIYDKYGFKFTALAALVLQVASILGMGFTSEKYVFGGLLISVALCQGFQMLMYLNAPLKMFGVDDGTKALPVFTSFNFLSIGFSGFMNTFVIRNLGYEPLFLIFLPIVSIIGGVLIAALPSQHKKEESKDLLSP